MANGLRVRMPEMNNIVIMYRSDEALRWIWLAGCTNQYGNGKANPTEPRTTQTRGQSNNGARAAHFKYSLCVRAQEVWRVRVRCSPAASGTATLLAC